MKKQTVKQKIFYSNASMILITLLLVLIINVIFLKIYWESIEQTWFQSMENSIYTTDLKNVIEEWTLHQKSFYFLITIDLCSCGIILILISSYFSSRLVKQLMEPIHSLKIATNRIRQNHFEEKMHYEGILEFEDITSTFNDMQDSILLEKEKNKKYEIARTEMIAGISHDLKTPLTAIKGSIKALLDGIIQDEKQKELFLNTAYKRTEDMDVLLNALFYISKLETGGIPLHFQNISLTEWITNYIDTRQSLDDPNLIFQKEFEEINHYAKIDPEEFKRIFDNLVENSKKYSGACPLIILVQLKEEKESLLLIFKDNGKGVQEDKLQAIFEEFYQEDPSRNNKNGSGLGLYIVKTLIQAMHGRVYAKKNSGLEIYIELPKGDCING